MGPVLEKHDLFSIFEFLFSENRKKYYSRGVFDRVGRVTGNIFFGPTVILQFSTG